MQLNRSISFGFYTSGDPLEVTCSAAKGEAVVETTISTYSARRCERNVGRGWTLAFNTGQEQNVLVMTGHESEPDGCAKATAVVGYIIHNLGDL